MEKEKTYKIYWIIVNKKTLNAEMHSLGFSDRESYEGQIQYLTKIHVQRGKPVLVKYGSGKRTCNIIVGL